MASTFLFLQTVLFILHMLIVDRGIYSLDNGLALTPPMGWLTWQRFRCNIDCTNYPNDCINEALIKRTADKMLSGGYLAAGYNYVIIDDCWMMKTRNPLTQELQADPERFPSGIKMLADYVHAKGLKFGIYLDFGTKTCAGYQGSLFHLQLDAQSLAKWGVDYVKMDGCYSDQNIHPEGYEIFSHYLNMTGRPMVFLCSYPAYTDWTSSPSLLDWNRLQNNCNLWRMFGDIDDSWSSLVSIIESTKNQNKLLVNAAGPSHWNDPDMLLLGDFGLSLDQAKTQMALWAMFAAPLMISADLETVSEEHRLLLTNKELIALNQDKAGKQAVFLKTINSYCLLWKRELVNSFAIAINNLASGGGPMKLSVKLFDDFDFPGKERVYELRDYFTGEIKAKNLTKDQPFDVIVNPNGVVLLHII